MPEFLPSILSPFHAGVCPLACVCACERVCAYARVWKVEGWVMSNLDFVHPGFALSVEGLQMINYKSLKIYIVAKMIPVVMGVWWYLSCKLAKIQ